MASLKGSILVTGSGGGLGSAIVSQILSRQEIAKDYYGLYTVRKVSTATTVSKILEKATSVSHKHELVTLDLSSLANVRRAAEDINKRVANGSLPPIRALVLNAGYQEHIGQTFTDDGFDSSFQANYLSHFLLTLMLLESMDKEKGRIVVLGSWTHEYAFLESSILGDRTDKFSSTTDPRNKLGPLAEVYVPEKYRQIFNDPMDVESVAKGKWSSEEEYPGDINAGHRRYGAAKLCEMLML
jgi:NAD(P)-dependent dehydrogenase (short-subunit alcohol dehydrogenase family)